MKRSRLTAVLVASLLGLTGCATQPEAAGQEQAPPPVQTSDRGDELAAPVPIWNLECEDLLPSDVAAALGVGVAPVPNQDSRESLMLVSYAKRVHQSLECTWADSDVAEVAAVRLTVDAGHSADVEAAAFGLSWDVGTQTYCEEMMGVDTACNGVIRKNNGDSIIVNYMIVGELRPDVGPDFDGLVAAIDVIFTEAERGTLSPQVSALPAQCESVVSSEAIGQALGLEVAIPYLQVEGLASTGVHGCETVASENWVAIKWMPSASWAWHDAEKSRTGEPTQVGGVDAFVTCEAAQQACATDFMIEDTWVSVYVQTSAESNAPDSASGSEAIAEALLQQR